MFLYNQIAPQTVTRECSAEMSMVTQYMDQHVVHYGDCSSPAAVDTKKGNSPHSAQKEE